MCPCITVSILLGMAAAIKIQDETVRKTNRDSMKKLVLSLIALGIINFAQATTITLVANSSSAVLKSSSITGDKAYEFLFNLGLTPNETISVASINFNGIKFTSSEQKPQIFTDLISAGGNTVGVSVVTPSDGDAAGDYFQSSSFSSHDNATQIGDKLFYTTWTFWGRTYYNTITAPQTWSYALDPSDLNNGIFDIGIDPDCIYNVGSISFSYTTVQTPHPPSVPDTATTAGLLGASLLGLLALRRKLAVQ